MLSQKRLREVVSFNEDTGEFHYVVSGERAGRDLDGYVRIDIDGSGFQAHRLAWFWMYGYFPQTDIDHIDKCRSNNRPSNLRLATRSQNMLNISAHKDSATGIKNVSFRKDTGKYSVRLSINGKYKVIGSFTDIETASRAATEARMKYHGEYARHV
jgi:hypothetical protein